MAAYGTLVAWARALGHDEAADLLQETLDEEKAADEKLSAIAEGGVNQEAAGAGSNAEEEESGKPSSRNGMRRVNASALRAPAKRSSSRSSQKQTARRAR